MSSESAWSMKAQIHHEFNEGKTSKIHICGLNLTVILTTMLTILGHSFLINWFSRILIQDSEHFYITSWERIIFIWMQWLALCHCFIHGGYCKTKSVIKKLIDIIFLWKYLDSHDVDMNTYTYKYMTTKSVRVTHTIFFRKWDNAIYTIIEQGQGPKRWIGTTRDLREHVCAIWLSSAQYFSRSAPETKCASKRLNRS